jgi:hypothetical protein
MEIVWVTILSKVANQDESAEGEPQAVVSDTLGVDPSLEIELSRQMMAGGELSYASATGWSDCTEDSEDCYVWTGGGEETKPSTLVLPSAEELLQVHRSLEINSRSTRDHRGHISSARFDR